MPDLIGLIGYLLEAALLWRLIQWRAWRYFPVFFSYWLFLLLRQGVIGYLGSQVETSSVSYSRWFWYSSNLSDVLRLVVAWEVYRKAFQPGSAAQRFAGALLAFALLGLAAFYSFAGAQDTNFFVAIGLNANFAVSIWILGVLALLQYYRIPISRNLWGIALGLGLFSATAIVNYSTLGLNEQAFPVFGFIRAGSFVGSLLIWTACLWTHRPAPVLTPSVNPVHSDPSQGPLQATTDTVGRALGLKPAPPDSRKD